MSLPGWQALHAELEPAGLTVATVALDIEPAHAHPWIDAAAQTHPSLIDTEHVTGGLFGFINIPMAVWIDESGTIVRNAETASIVRSPFRDLDIPDGLPDRMTQMLTEVKAIPDDSPPTRHDPSTGCTAARHRRTSSLPTRWWSVPVRGAPPKPRPPPASSSAGTFGPPSARTPWCRGGVAPTRSTPATGHTSGRPGRWSRRPRMPPRTTSSRVPTTSTRATGSTTSSPPEAAATTRRRPRL